MKVRAALILALVLAVVLLTPRAAGAQQANKVSRIGYLSSSSADADVAYSYSLMLLEYLRDLGYVEVQNIVIEPGFAEGKPDRLPALAAELVRRNVDVIVSTGGDAAALAAKNATRTIPIVFIAGGDPVGLGLVSSLGRPGGNMTAVSILVSELDAKRLALLKDLVPKVTFVAVLLNPLNPNTGLP